MRTPFGVHHRLGGYAVHQLARAEVIKTRMGQIWLFDPWGVGVTEYLRRLSLLVAFATLKFKCYRINA